MKVEQIYTGCLAQGAYIIESDGEIAIIDPLRDVLPYLDRISSSNSKLKYIFETHFHADFVSGHLSLAEKTGAPIIFGPTAEPSFKATIAEDNQIFKLGKVKIKVLHTPGHTMESSCFLLYDEADRETALFSGDTLFLGDVGRPDLAQNGEGLTVEKLAGYLFDSLRNKIMPLSDEIIVYPAHGAGSACGKNMMKATSDLLGHQKEMNYALRKNMTKSEFITEVTSGLTPPPAYFPINVKMNKEGYSSVKRILDNEKAGLGPKEFEALANSSGAVVLDIRSKESYAAAHIPRSISIGLNGDFAPWVGCLIKDTLQPILLVGDREDLEEAVTRLSRVGFDNVIGYLENGIEAWISADMELDQVKNLSAPKLYELLQKENAIEIIDVRKNTEYVEAHILGAHNFPLAYLSDHYAHFAKDKTYYVHCKSGYRSVIACSMLKAKGIHNVINVTGGFDGYSSVLKDMKKGTTFSANKVK